MSSVVDLWYCSNPKKKYVPNAWKQAPLIVEVTGHVASHFLPAALYTPALSCLNQAAQSACH